MKSFSGRVVSLACAVFLCVACGKAAPPAQDAQSASAHVERAPESSENHRAAAERLLAMMKMQQVMDTIIESSLNQFSAQPQLANLRESMREFFNKYMSWESLKGDMIQLYMDAYTQRELEDLIAFYETPTGKKSIALMPELAAKGAEIGQRRVGEHLPELKAMITARLREQRGGAAAPDAPPKGH